MLRVKRPGSPLRGTSSNQPSASISYPQAGRVAPPLKGGQPNRSSRSAPHTGGLQRAAVASSFRTIDLAFPTRRGMGMSIAAARIPTYRAVSFPAPHTICEHRPDGSILMRSARKPAEVSQSSYADWVPYWAERRGSSLALCERDVGGAWRPLTWVSLWSQVQAVAAALLGDGTWAAAPTHAALGQFHRASCPAVSGRICGGARRAGFARLFSSKRRFHSPRRLREFSPRGRFSFNPWSLSSARLRRWIAPMFLSSQSTAVPANSS